MDKKVYELNDFNDLLKIPLDKLSICLDELATTIIAAKINLEYAKKMGNVKDEKIIKLPIIWKDDNKDEIRMIFDLTTKASYE